MSDSALLDRWRAGDKDAGKELFERHFQAIYRFFCNKVGRDVDDLVQETFLGCTDAKNRFRGDSSFRTFLFAIARRQLYKYRDRHARDSSVEEFDASRAADLDALPSQLMISHQEQKLLLRGLRRIPLEMQIALELFYWDGLTSAQLAEVLDIPHGTVRSRLRRAKELLRKHMARLQVSQSLLASTTDNLEAWLRSMRGHVADSS